MSVTAGDRAAPISAASFLRRVPVLAELDRELLKQLAEEARTIELRAGEWLVRRGRSGGEPVRDSLRSPRGDQPRARPSS